VVIIVSEEGLFCYITFIIVSMLYFYFFALLCALVVLVNICK
jgi:hypothetical protein